MAFADRDRRFRPRLPRRKRWGSVVDALLALSILVGIGGLVTLISLVLLEGVGWLALIVVPS